MTHANARRRGPDAGCRGPDASRREFLRVAGALSTLGAAGAGLALNLASIGTAAAQSAPGDYKALVCLFMFGGNDYANTVLAYDPASWSGYVAARDFAPDPIALAHPATPVAGRTILPIAHANANGLNGGRSFALHPNLDGLKSLFDAKTAAIVANVGPLKQPTTKAQFRTAGYPLPDKLFSHNDQQSTWMAFGPEGTANVTLFTASDFGRTLTSNGDGSDHGWGSHHIVVGGAVKGGDVYGRFPQIGLNTPDEVGEGRLLPALSVDQYAAALGRWFGVSNTDLLTVMPNLSNFGTGSMAGAIVDSALAGASFMS